MTAQQECSQCSLVVMESTTSLPILFISSYNSTTGLFTVPPGGDGVYYFSLYLLVDDGEVATFDMRHNNNVICSANPGHNHHGDTDELCRRGGDSTPAVLLLMLLLVKKFSNAL